MFRRTTLKHTLRSIFKRPATLLRSKLAHIKIKQGLILHSCFIIGIVILTLAYAFTYTSFQPVANKIPENNLKAIILSGEYNGKIFKYVHSARVDNSLMLIESKERLKTGYRYVLNGDFTITYFNSDNSSFQSYRLSQGYRGVIQIDRLNAIAGSCDSYCWYLEGKEKLTRSLSRSIRTKLCYTWEKVISFLYLLGPCNDIASFQVGLLIRDSTPVSDNLSNLMKSAGLAHIISVSGFQITSLGLMLELMIQRVNLGRKQRLFLILPLLLGYAQLAGFNPPVIRAFLSTMISWGILVFIGRRVTAFHSLLYSSLLMLIVYPHFITSYSFLLTFTATLGLVLTPNVRYGSAVKEAVFGSILTTTMAFLLTFPIVSQFGNAMNPLLVLAGSLILPIIPLITILTILGPIPIIGDIAILFSGSVLSISLSLLNELARLISVLVFTPNNIIDTIVFYIIIGLILLIYAIKRRNNPVIKSH